MTSHVTTHVLDTALGRPAAGVPVRFERATSPDRSAWSQLATADTDGDGRIRDLGPQQLGTGVYRVVFDTSAYFARTGQQGFFPEASVTFELSDTEAHYHIPLLLSPFAFSTYRGS